VKLPEHRCDLSKDATLQDVIRAINVGRERERATYLAPFNRWTDTRDSGIETVESFVTA
jgi:hypothetical protein